MSDHYEIKWKRDPDAQRPEDIHGGTREEAVRKMLEEEGINTDSVSINIPQRRHLSKSYGLYTVCELVIENPAEAALVAKWGKDKVNEIIFEEDGREKLKQNIDEEWEEID
jgi:hypothetical protein